MPTFEEGQEFLCDCDSCTANRGLAPGPDVKEGLTKKDTNPKDAIGDKKPSLSVIPMPVLYEVAVALTEGSCKYGRHNWRVAGVRASVYYNANMRHINDWWEGQDIDPASGVHHLSKAIAGLMVLRDAMIQGKLEQDDRPPPSPKGWMDDIQKLLDGVLERYPDPLPPYTKDDVE